MYRMLAVLPLACALVFGVDAQPQAFPLWDGHESIEQYAKRTNLEPAKTLDLGNGVKLELVLIPAGKFTMGTPEPKPKPVPKPVDKEWFLQQITVGAALFDVGGGVLLVLIVTVVIRAIRQRRWPQYSLARFMAMVLAASVAVLGGMHWWHSAQALAQAQVEYKAALARCQSFHPWEKPAHEVTLATPFYMGKHEVTQEQYEQVTGTNPSRFAGANLPVEKVSWDDAQQFCENASEKAEQVMRLPTEAEWEYACRAGTTTTYCTGDAEADLGRAAWYGMNSGGRTHSVGEKTPNAWGVYDMHGNVWEWCQDWYEEYKSGAVVDPQGPTEGQHRVLRGGASYLDPRYCRSANRCGHVPDRRDDDFGFRVVVEVPPMTP